MDFTQKGFLWALFAALLPLIIHLLNRLRYKTVPWAAMMFLRTANRQATRRARIRQILLLLARTLVIFFFVWAMIRPVTGGWLATASGNSAETVLVLLDRSASMESRDPQRQTSVREHALKLLATASKEGAFRSRFILIDSATREAVEIADPGQIAGLTATSATDTAANLPLLFRDAADYIARNKPGSVEIWVISDLQRSNWMPDSAEWADVEARLMGLTLKPVIRVLDLAGHTTDNQSIGLESARLTTVPPPRVELQTEIRSDPKPTAPVPLVITRNGARSQQDIALNSTIQRILLTLPVDKDTLNWGKLQLPPDNNMRDNSAWFLCQPDLPVDVLVVSTDPAVERPLLFAAAPNPADKSTVAQVVAPDALPAKMDRVSLILWQAPAPKDKAAEQRLKDFVESGGVLLLFPPTGPETSAPLGVAWDKAQTAKEDEFWTAATWEENDGPLARGRSGRSLQVNRVPVSQKRVPQLPETEKAAARVYASFQDGSPLLIGTSIGQGRLYACATLPKDSWSALGRGIVLLPMTQRLARDGARRLSPPLLNQVGVWKPPVGPGVWAPADGGNENWRWDAGVYRNGDQFVALNRPAIEDEPGAISPEDIQPLLPKLRVDVMKDALGRSAGSVRSEIWPLMILATMLFLVVEMVLTLARPEEKKADLFPRRG